MEVRLVWEELRQSTQQLKLAFARRHILQQTGVLRRGSGLSAQQRRAVSEDEDSLGDLNQPFTGCLPVASEELGEPDGPFREALPPQPLLGRYRRCQKLVERFLRD